MLRFGYRNTSFPPVHSTHSHTSEGWLLAWVENEFSQCGISDSHPVKTPTEITYLKGAVVSTISAAVNNSAAILVSGDIVVWGKINDRRGIL